MNLSESRKGILSIFPVPKYLSLGTMACSIDHDTIRYIEFSGKSGKRYIKKFGSKKMKSEIKDFKTSLPQIKKEIAEVFGSLGTKSVSLIIPERFVYVFVTTIPFTEKSFIKEAISFQLEEHIPITAEDALFEYDIVSSDKNKNSMTIAVRAVPRQEIEIRTELFSSLGFIVPNLDTMGKCIAEAISCENCATRMIIHVNRVSTSFIVSKDGNVFFSSTLSIGSVDIDRALSKVFSVPEDEVASIKESFHGNPVPDKKMFDALVPILSSVRDEVMKIISYWNARPNAGKDPIVGIILSGEDVTLPGVTSYLDLAFKLPVSFADVWKNAGLSKKSVPKISFEESLVCAPIIGLATFQ